MLKQNNSQCSFSKSYAQDMSESSDQQWRQKRIADLARLKGGNASLGRLLGYRDGAYVGQMISGHRAITEKLVEKIHALHGFRTWFLKEPLATAVVAQDALITASRNARECLDKLGNILTEIDPATREEIGDLLSHFARGLRPTTKEAILAVIDASGKPEQQKAA
jgi:hypothetical protein